MAGIHSKATQKRMPCLNRSTSFCPILREKAISFCPILREKAMRAASEYPKIIAERWRSSVAACEREYLRLTPNEDGTATLAVCRHEAPASAEEFVNENGEVHLPDSTAGKPVAGIEDDWIVGGELACHGSRWTYRATEITSAIDWVRLNGWVPTNYIVAEILQAALVSAHLVKSAGAPPALSPN
jgi:hypothetical protein